jgi:hypothetical protein
VHADKTVAAAFIQMLNKEPDAIRICHRQAMTLLVLPIQQMGDRTQVSATLTARVTAIDKMPAKGIKQLGTWVAAQMGNQEFGTKEMFKHGALLGEPLDRWIQAALRIYAQLLNAVTPSKSTRKETSYA